MKHRLSIMLIWFCGLAVSAMATEMYHTNRTFTPVTINVQGNPPLVDQLYTETGKFTDIVKGTNITINTNETCAIEKQVALPVCYGSAEGAWNAALVYNGTTSNYPGKIFDNVGWVRGTKLAHGEWGAYLWVIQNRIVFCSSETNWWVSPSNGLRVAISNVLVGSLGDYPPMATNIVDIGPHLDAATNNFPGADISQDKSFGVDITNVYYRLVIPSIWITPREAYALVGGSNVPYEVAVTNSTNVTWTITPDGLTSGAVLQVSNDWHYAGVTPGIVATNYLIRATATDNTNYYDEVPFVVSDLTADMVPDFNHDRVIDDTDKSLLLMSGPFRFWANDDDDSGDIADGDSDLPGHLGWGTSPADYSHGGVDGRCDLLDFFPLWLDLNETLNLLPPSDTVQYKMKQADAAVNVVYTDLTKGEAGSFLTVSGNTFSASFDQKSYEADTVKITSSGITLSTNFLNKIKNDATKGVLMVEGRKATTAPLVLEIWNNGKKICQKEMSLKLSGVEAMYRWINLRPSGGLPTSTGEPVNNPDSLSNGKNVFFLHGFSVTANEARGRSAEIFKRLYWSGSLAKFWGMTWEGDVGWINSLYYQDRAAAALNNVASNFYAQVNGISGTKIILAHSLGNMVVSGAIQDYGLSVSKYFMLNAAVATESYDPTVFNDATNGNYMLHEDWVGYNSNTWCSTWFRLFSSPDDRAKLTWKNRFPSVLSVAYNFYSSGDELFEVYPGTLSPFAGGLIPFYLEQYAWQKQEIFKGRSSFGGTLWAGWGFSGGYTVEQANNATEDNLRTNAVFLHEPSAMFSSNITNQVVNEVIAKGVPALSYASGETNIEGVIFNYNANTDAHKPNSWGRNDDKYGTRWLHSDLVDMAYYYTYDLFNQIVSQGGLQ